MSNAALGSNAVCRSCGSDNTHMFVDLGMSPLCEDRKSVV